MKLESIALHHGYESEATTKAAAVRSIRPRPTLSTTPSNGADLFDLKVPRNNLLPAS